MKITCPDHSGLIYVNEPIFDKKNILINKVVECPVCDDEVLINGIYNIDAEGLAIPIAK